MTEEAIDQIVRAVGSRDRSTSGLLCLAHADGASERSVWLLFAGDTLLLEPRADGVRVGPVHRIDPLPGGWTGPGMQAYLLAVLPALVANLGAWLGSVDPVPLGTGAQWPSRPLGLLPDVVLR